MLRFLATLVVAVALVAPIALMWVYILARLGMVFGQ